MENDEFINYILDRIIVESKNSIKDVCDNFDEINYTFNLSELIKSKEDLVLSAIIPLKEHSAMSVGGPFYVHNGIFKKLNNLVNKTYSSENLINHYRNRLGIDSGFIKASDIDIKILIINIHDNLEFIKNAMYEFGWRFSDIKYCFYYNVLFVMIIFKPMFKS